MTSVAQARRNRKARASLPGLAPVKKRKSKDANRSKEIEIESGSVALEARARQMGIPVSKAGEMRDQILGDPAGMALAIVCGYKKKAGMEEAKKLYDHYVAMTTAERRYHRSIGTSLDPKTAKIEMAPERFEASADDNVDLRTPEERDRAAQSKWMHWQGNLGRLPAVMQTHIHDVARARREPVSEGKATPAGVRFVAAMREMDRLMEVFG